MKLGKRVVAGAVILLLTGCAPGDAGDASPTDGLKVSSPAFAESAEIPEKYVCTQQGGENVSPPLTWTGVPESARELAIVVDDPDAPGGTYIHWIVTGIPVSATSVSEGQAQGKVLPGSDGQAAYAGPCPPSGVHHYHFIVYALRGPVAPSGDAKSTHQQIKDAAVASGETVGVWGS
ncbi:YbhB/YbcL family Raf kinase inhibitor-like protein [Microbispora sp. H10836]|uniref:YbhB/YbcL family Raf kinase inhibitor-like protein n=1 Tax=Microbispora sp. H10836 TaxID=2729106 RepID=UPI0014765202|nr:YbhB/YbcL family Raf kinase inhibitor-like protein [Microbispora sp. H10836]